MSQISPPIRILLAAVIGVIAVYMLFLRPKPDAATPAAAVPAAVTPVPAKDPGAKTNSGTGAIVQKAVTDTQAASGQSKVAAGEAPGGLASDGTAGTTGVNTSPVTAAPSTGDTGAPGAPVSKQALADLPKDVRHAVAKHKVLVLLFYNNRSADDRAVRRALSHVNTYGGQVFIAPHWIKTVARYQAIARGVDVEQSPTIVVTDRNLKAETLVGYTDADTIDQTVVDAILAGGGSIIKNPYYRKIEALCTSAQAQITALPQPSSASAVPAYLSGAQQAAASMTSQAAAIKPAKQYRGFHKHFVTYAGATTSRLAIGATSSKAKPADGAKILQGVGHDTGRLDSTFVAKNGRHGLSCF
jgi:hypothetical protein